MSAAKPSGWRPRELSLVTSEVLFFAVVLLVFPLQLLPVITGPMGDQPATELVLFGLRCGVELGTTTV